MKPVRCVSASEKSVFLTLTGYHDPFSFDLRQNKSDLSALSLFPESKQDPAPQIFVFHSLKCHGFGSPLLSQQDAETYSHVCVFCFHMD